MDFLVNPFTDPYYNMALDEYCLNAFPDRLFFYLWRNEPSVILGCNQDVYKETDIAYCEQHDIHIVRRCTGGGMVYHDLGNLNFSFVGDARNPRQLSEFQDILVNAFRQLGLEVKVTGRNDLYVDGCKFSGTAARTSEERLLFHGTILFDADLNRIGQVSNQNTGKIRRKAVDSHPAPVVNIRSKLNADTDMLSFIQRLQDILRGTEGEELQLNDSEILQIRQLANEKYRTRHWIYQEPENYTIRCSAQMKSGLVIAYLLLEDNVIQSAQFRGDFLGLKDISAIERLLNGCSYTKYDIQQRLSGVTVSDYLMYDTAEDLLRLLIEN